MIKNISILLISFALIFTFYPNISEAQRGCCSWHGGVSYCGSDGYYVCNDGQRSPTCTCGGGGLSEDSSRYYKTQIPEYLIKDVKANITPQLIDNGQGCGYNVDVEIDTPGIYGTTKTSLTRSNKDIANKVGDSVTYKDFTPGKWYLNTEIRSSLYDLPSYLYLDVNLPDVVPYSEVKLGENDMVTYSLKCIKAISSTNETLQRGIVLSKNKSDGSSEGAFQASDVYGRQEVVVTDYYGKQYTSVLEFPDESSPISASLDSIGDEGGDLGWVIPIALLLGMIAIFIGANQSEG